MDGMNNLKTISVAMATYNGEKYIREQLDSLALQTLSPFELIVTDDGSTDSTLAIVEEFSTIAPFPVKVYRNKERLGYADNFLKAASLCQGEYVAFCDQDDIWLPNKLAVCADGFITTDVKMVVHSGNVVDGNGTHVGVNLPCVRNHKIQRLGMHPQKFYQGYAIIFRRDLIDFVNADSRPDENESSKKMAHDVWIPFLANIFGSTRLLNDSLVLYRRHGSNASGYDSAHRHALMPDYVKTKRCAEVYSVSLDNIVRRSLWLKSLPHSGGAHRGNCLRDAVRVFESHCRYLEKRIAMYHKNNILYNFHQLINIVLSGGYRNYKNGGMGFKAFLGDAFRIVMSVRLF